MLLTRQDWRGPEAAWTPTAIGHWELDIRKAGGYEVTFLLPSPALQGEVLTAKLAGATENRKLDAGATSVAVRFQCQPGAARLECRIEGAGKPRGAQYAEVKLA